MFLPKCWSSMWHTTRHKDDAALGTQLTHGQAVWNYSLRATELGCESSTAWVL